MNEKEKQLRQLKAYFTKWSGLPYLGLGIAALGLLIFLFRYRLGILFFLPYLLFAAGIILYFYAYSATTSEKDFNVILNSIVGRYENEELDESLISKHGREYEIPETLFFSGFVYKEGALYKLMKNGTVASDIYNTVKLYFIEKGLYFKISEFSLTEDKCDEKGVLIKYPDIKSVSLERRSVEITVDKDKKNEMLCYAVINYSDNEKIYIPHPDDALAESFCGDIMKKISSRSKK